MVELVLVKVEAANQGMDRTITRIECNEGTFHLGQLRDFPCVLCRLGHPDDGAATNLDVGRSLVAQA